LKITKAKIKRVMFRSRFYYGLGSSLINLPLVFLGLSRNLYNLFDGIDLFVVLFPTFNKFVVIGTVFIFPFGVFLGYAWTKSRFYKEGITTQAERNPFAFKLAPTKESLLYFGQLIGQKNMLRLFKKEGTITEDEEERYLEYIAYMERLERGESIEP
jgi:hypothetical protein